MSNAGQPGVRFRAGQFSSCAELEGKSCLMLSRIQGFFPLKKSPREGRFGVEQWQILGSLPCSEEPRALLWLISPTAASRALSQRWEQKEEILMESLCVSVASCLLFPPQEALWALFCALQAAIWAINSFKLRFSWREMGMLCGPLPPLGLREQHGSQISIPSPYLLAAFATPCAPPASRDPYQPRPGGFPPHISIVGAGLLEPRSPHAELCAEFSLVLLVGVHCPHCVPIGELSGWGRLGFEAC